MLEVSGTAVALAFCFAFSSFKDASDMLEVSGTAVALSDSMSTDSAAGQGDSASS
eukprot:CAMPEP_0197705594 /NCGR_PEP_ID=MMETSP1338-20131121/126523_1 /TAXON_ID=43686 ORGANISM="Pelagodinium beii, Strain RCC1491" /NCGR_SAMPLE_ID=MMETSP1338 /ASSEMBLY_ACC=CAM_ASM_000754 /LENGTH=54 /DNA_ID=CAMNT_0043289503 /DNA_START=442 /DNA_END=606 /DNA_ORIENTATION=-